MQISSIDLSDAQSVRLDESGVSSAYFCVKSPVKVDTVLISDIKAIAKRLGKRNIRLCLHDTSDATFHNMIIFEQKGKYYRPHKHPPQKGGETFHMIEGSMAVFAFDENGQVIDASILKTEGNLIYRIGANKYHAVMPLSDFVIYHESKPGPFLGEKDSIYPSWATDGSDENEVSKYSNRLLEVLEFE